MIDDGWRACGACHHGWIDGRECRACAGLGRYWAPVEDPYRAPERVACRYGCGRLGVIVAGKRDRIGAYDCGRHR